MGDSASPIMSCSGQAIQPGHPASSSMLSTVVLVSTRYIGTFDTRCSRASWITSAMPSTSGTDRSWPGLPAGLCDIDSVKLIMSVAPFVHVQRRDDGVAGPRLRLPQDSLRQLSALPAARRRPQATSARSFMAVVQEALLQQLRPRSRTCQAAAAAAGSGCSCISPG